MTSSKKMRGRAERANKPPKADASRILAPSRLPADAHRHYESEFVPIRLTEELREHKGVKILLTAVEDDILELWELGRKGTHISSHFVTCEGTEDFLTSTSAEDDDYGSLVDAHISRLAGIMGLAPNLVDP